MAAFLRKQLSVECCKRTLAIEENIVKNLLIQRKCNFQCHFCSSKCFYYTQNRIHFVMLTHNTVYAEIYLP